jgi:hypothetical protein
MTLRVLGLSCPLPAGGGGSAAVTGATLTDLGCQSQVKASGFRDLCGTLWDLVEPRSNDVQAG